MSWQAACAEEWAGYTILPKPAVSGGMVQVAATGDAGNTWCRHRQTVPCYFCQSENTMCEVLRAKARRELAGLPSWCHCIDETFGLK